jgi:signal transduction histidine kinase
MTIPEKLHFKTHAELKNIIGQDLINDDNIAIIELVKNGLDANSKKIEVEFSVESNASDNRLIPSRIIISDYGTGMAKSDLVEKWLNIAYSEKKVLQPKDRMLAGNKGVGRFACDRLGQKLDMYTKKEGKKILHLSVDWTKFENKQDIDAAIQKIPVEFNELTDLQYAKETARKAFSSGTVLVITQLRAEWDRAKLTDTKRYLERFVNPNSAFDKSSFSINLIADHLRTADRAFADHLRINGRVENQIFEKLKFNTTYATANIDETGKLISTELFHEGERVYRVVERNDVFGLLANTSVLIHYMNPYKKAYFKRQTGLNTVEFGAIFLFLNGYRIPPYGERDNDWLRLDNRKNQGSSRFLGNREVVGRVEILDRSARFRVVSNREGLARSAAFKQLVDTDGFFYSVFKRLEKFVVDGLDWDSVPESERIELEAGLLPGDGKKPLLEIYRESTDKKRRRIALNAVKLIGATPKQTIDLHINPLILNALIKERSDEVHKILARFGEFEGAVDKSVQLALNKVEKEFVRQSAALVIARNTVSRKEKQLVRLKDIARTATTAAKDAEVKVKTQESELMFARLAAGTDKDVLMLLHHQNGIYAATVKNQIDRAIRALAQGDTKKVSEHLEKAMLGIKRVVTASDFATKANFKMKTDTITQDLVNFLFEYINNVAKDVSASDLSVRVQKTFDDPFVVRFKPIDIAIVIDNLASNSSRANAKKFDVLLDRPAENEMRILIRDDGGGLVKEISPLSAIFNAGVTTTSGSGLGLYHVRQTIEQMGGTVEVDESYSGGFGVCIRIFK